MTVKVRSEIQELECCLHSSGRRKGSLHPPSKDRNCRHNSMCELLHGNPMLINKMSMLHFRRTKKD